MKPLILILLAAVCAAAQNPTIADIARQERARRTQDKSTKVYTIEDIRSAEPAVAEPEKAPAKDAPAPAPAKAPEAATTVPAATAAPAGPDPVQQWLQETGKVRDQIRDLIDQEAKAQIEINAITNRIYAPVTSQSDKDKATAELQVAKQKLVAIRVQLDKNRKDLQTREAQGPPKK